jgi:hypothetical protein
MAFLKKAQSDPQAKTAAAKSVLKVAKPVTVGTGRSRVNLFAKQELDEYARANPDPGFLGKISDRIRGLLKKLTKPP